MDKWFAYVHEGYAKHPCTRVAYIHGFAVGRVRPYRSIETPANP